VSKHTPEQMNFHARLSGSENHKGFAMRIGNNLVGEFYPLDEDGIKGKAVAEVVTNRFNACTGMSDPDKEIKALREVAEACEKLRSEWTPQHVATTALDFAVVDVILALAALKAEGEGKT